MFADARRSDIHAVEELLRQEESLSDGVDRYFDSGANDDMTLPGIAFGHSFVASKSVPTHITNDDQEDYTNIFTANEVNGNRLFLEQFDEDYSLQSDFVGKRKNFREKARVNNTLLIKEGGKDKTNSRLLNLSTAAICGRQDKWYRKRISAFSHSLLVFYRHETDDEIQNKIFVWFWFGGVFILWCFTMFLNPYLAICSAFRLNRFVHRHRRYKQIEAK